MAIQETYAHYSHEYMAITSNTVPKMTAKVATEKRNICISSRITIALALLRRCPPESTLHTIYVKQQSFTCTLEKLWLYAGLSISSALYNGTTADTSKLKYRSMLKVIAFGQ